MKFLKVMIITMAFALPAYAGNMSAEECKYKANVTLFSDTNMTKKTNVKATSKKGKNRVRSLTSSQSQ